jgi:hypothetical protein
VAEATARARVVGPLLRGSQVIADDGTVNEVDALIAPPLRPISDCRTRDLRFQRPEHLMEIGRSRGLPVTFQDHFVLETETDFTEPFAALLRGDLNSALAGGENALLEMAGSSAHRR